MSLEKDQIEEINQRAENVGEVVDYLLRNIRPDLETACVNYDRQTVSQALQIIDFHLTQRDIINTYPVSDEVFEELVKAKDMLEMDVSDLTLEEFEDWLDNREPEDHRLDSLREVKEEHGRAVVETFVDMMIYCPKPDRQEYVEAATNWTFEQLS